MTFVPGQDLTPDQLALKAEYDAIWEDFRWLPPDEDGTEFLRRRMLALHRDDLTPDQLALQHGYERSWETSQEIQADPQMMALLKERIRLLDEQPQGPVMTRDELLLALAERQADDDIADGRTAQFDTAEELFTDLDDDL